MVKYTYQPSEKTKQFLRFFALGLGIGIFLQQAVELPAYQAYIIRPISLTSSSYSSKTSKLTLRQQRLALRILRRNILKSANEQGLRSFIVADASIHQAAPLEPTAEFNASSESSFMTRSATSTATLSQSSAISVSSVTSSVSASAQSVSSVSDFPPFIRALFPFPKTPDWGAMRTSKEWDRSYKEMNASDFVDIPNYNLQILTIPMKNLSNNLTRENVAKITAKLFYSTRFFGSYDVDSAEFEAVHPGLDLKVAEGTPVGAIAGGKVVAVRRDDSSFGLYILIEHRLSDDERWLSLYGHMQTAIVHPGDAVLPGQMIGRSGSTGNSSAPHLHLQIERLTGDADTHEIYRPSSVPSAAEAALHVIHPITFFEKYKRIAQ